MNGSQSLQLPSDVNICDELHLAGSGTGGTGPGTGGTGVTLRIHDKPLLETI